MILTVKQLWLIDQSTPWYENEQLLYHVHKSTILNYCYSKIQEIIFCEIIIKLLFNKKPVFFPSGVVVTGNSNINTMIMRHTSP